MASSSSDRGGRPWWRNPQLTVPLAGTLAAAIIGAAVAVWTTGNGDPPSGEVAAPGTTRPSLPPSAPTVSPPSSTTPAAGPGIRRRGTITLVPESSFDLDSTDPRWDEGVGDRESDVAGYGGPPVAIFINPYPSYLKLGAGDPSAYDACSGTTGYRNNVVIDHNDIEVGDRYCIVTGQKRYSLVQVRSTSPAKIEVLVTVWEKEE